MEFLWFNDDTQNVLNELKVALSKIESYQIKMLMMKEKMQDITKRTQNLKHATLQYYKQCLFGSR